MTLKNLCQEKEKSELIQNKIAILRLLGYIGVQFNSLLVPLLVFQITKSVSLAGFSLVIEWIPKLVFYVIGGAFVERYQSKNIHMGLEVIRLICLFFVLAGVLNLVSVWVVAICAAAYQCANALSNILFERAVTTNWKKDDRTQGHAKIFQQDQLGCFLALLLGLIIKSLFVLSVVAITIQILTVIGVMRYSKKIHASNIKSDNFFLQLKKDIKFVKQKEVLKFVIMSFLVSLPIAFVFSAIVFLIANSQTGFNSTTYVLSFLLLVKTALSISLLQIMRKYLLIVFNEKSLAYIGFAIILISGLILTQSLSLMWLIILVSIMGASLCLYLPWLRSQRQEMISKSIPLSSRSGVTGILIAGEALSYLMAALIMLVFNNLFLALFITCFLAAIGFYLAFNLNKQSIQLYAKIK